MKVRLLVHLPALSPCLSLQAKLWWRWIQATRRPHGAAPAPWATTGARTASAAAATASVRPALAPCSRVCIWGAPWDPHSLGLLVLQGAGGSEEVTGSHRLSPSGLFGALPAGKNHPAQHGTFHAFELVPPGSIFGFGPHLTMPIPGSGTTSGLRVPYCSAGDRTQVACARPEPC